MKRATSSTPVAACDVLAVAIHVMPQLLRASDNRNAPLVEPGNGALAFSYFNLLRLRAGQAATLDVPGCELLCVVLAGRADVAAGAQEFKNVGWRAEIWDGPADSVYCGTCPRVTVRAVRDGTEVAVAGGVCATPFAPFRIAPEEVQMVEVGSKETHSRRRIFHILGQNAAGRAGNLLVSELLGDEGCWSGYPPHKHDTERPPEETEFEEIYHYRYRPESGFGGQFYYEGGEKGRARPLGASGSVRTLQANRGGPSGPALPNEAASQSEDGAEPQVVMTRHGDTFLIDGGYHPTVRAPGYEGYMLTILVGRHQRSLVQYFEPAHAHLMAKIPGIQAMRDRFR
jgi:5-deoxy-glucuronate isomerase